MGDSGRTIRGKRGVRKTGLPKCVKDMSKEQLEATLKKKKECNEKAVSIVQQMLENVVSEEWFLSQLPYIDNSYFQDIIEERIICKLCGYPLCGEPLKIFPKQQYHISTKFNKVYDITERKKFCSSQCYKAAKFIQDQLSTSPLWLRDKEETPVFTLLPVGSKGHGTGEEVVFSCNADIKQEVKEMKKDDFMTVADFTQVSLSRMSRKIHEAEKKEETKLQDGDKKKENVQSQYKVDRSDNVKDQNEMERENYSNNNIDKEQNSPQIGKQNEDISVSDNFAFNYKSPHGMEEGKNLPSSENSAAEITANVGDSKYCCTEEKNSVSSDHLSERRGGNRKEQDKAFKNSRCTKTSPPDKVKAEKRACKERAKKQETEILVENEAKNSIIYIEKCLNEWFTVDSMCLLFGEQKVKDMVCDKGQCIKEYYKAVRNSSWDPEIQERYEALCRKLNLMELQEKQAEEALEERTLKPVPDYKVLREEGLKMDLKIRSFYQGSYYFELPPNCTVKTNEELTPSCVLPLVDIHAQNALRRRMVLDNLKRALPDQLRTFGLASRDVSSDVRSLVSTFTLSAHNITFKATEWSLISLMIIKMLSIKDMRLKILLESEQGMKYQTLMLMAFQQDGGYFDRLMVWLTDLDNIMKKKELKDHSS